MHSSTGTSLRYTLSADGLTVHDNVTGLTWQKSPDTNGDGVINSIGQDDLDAGPGAARCPERVPVRRLR
ncbi:MAG: DUF1566 domain-containing protein [Candidatus Moduliflexus flocculans]|nr:DUF1566 domain-containing protein [Candidatus Moduliflexus flocculans]